MGQENKPDNFCLAEKRSKALGDGALYRNIIVWRKMIIYGLGIVFTTFD